MFLCFVLAIFKSSESKHKNKTAPKYAKIFISREQFPDESCFLDFVEIVIYQVVTIAIGKIDFPISNM